MSQRGGREWRVWTRLPGSEIEDILSCLGGPDDFYERVSMQYTAGVKLDQPLFEVIFTGKGEVTLNWFGDATRPGRSR